MALDPASFVKQYENPSGNPYLGTGNTDLTSYIQSGNVNQYGFPNWAGISTFKGTSTAAGLYQITRTTWNSYAPQAGVSDFSPESQDKVFATIYNSNGFNDYTCLGCNPKLANALTAAGGISAFEPPGSYTVASGSGGGTLTYDPGGEPGLITGIAAPGNGYGSTWIDDAGGNYGGSGYDPNNPQTWNWHGLPNPYGSTTTDLGAGSGNQPSVAQTTGGLGGIGSAIGGIVSAVTNSAFWQRAAIVIIGLIVLIGAVFLLGAREYSNVKGQALGTS